jgi:antitoxin HigA-1
MHPGRLLQDVLKSFGLPITEAAARMGIARGSLYRVFEGKASVSAELALRFTRLTGGTPDFYLQMQDNFDLRQAQSRLKDELAKIQPLL